MRIVDEALLVGVRLPADKAALLEYAVRQHAEPALIDALQGLSPREFASLDEVAEELAHVQPRSAETSGIADAESVAPAADKDYT